MKNKKEENLENKKKRRKKIIIVIAIVIIAIIIGAVSAYDYFYGNKGYISADVTITSSSKLYSNSVPEDSEDVGEGALFILYIDGIKRDDFLAQYEVTEITINGEKVDLEKVTYRHLNKALSIRMYSDNYELEKGNVIVISIKEKSRGQIITKRLYHTTEVV